MPSATSDEPSIWSQQRAASFRHVSCEIRTSPARLTVRDLTLGGFEVESSMPLRIGTVHQCLFTVDGHVVSLSARVTETRYRPAGGGYTAGLEFRRIGTGDLRSADRLRSLVMGGRQPD
jgi:hypothetical protein